MKQHLKSFVMDQCCAANNWCGDHIDTDTLRWWLQDFFGEIFWWAYQDSDEELLSVDNDEIPVEYMSERQFAYYNRFALTVIPGGAA